MKRHSYLVIIWLVVMSSCNSNPKIQATSEGKVPGNSSSVSQNLNVSIFIDLSDRISPTIHPNATMEYHQRDTGYINSITKAFETHILHKKIVTMNDRIQLFIDPPPANAAINDIIKQLRNSFTKDNITKEKIEAINSTYSSLSAKIYDLAITDGQYIGSDIWGFFDTKIKDYCISNEHRNIFIILTDGYAYHEDNIVNIENRSSYLTTKRISQLGLSKPNWKDVLEDNDCGFIVKNTGLENIEILVLGLNAYKSSPFEEDVIRAFWSRWFDEMGVKKYEIKSADLPSNLDEVIQRFILTP